MIAQGNGDLKGPKSPVKTGEKIIIMAPAGAGIWIFRNGSSAGPVVSTSVDGTGTVKISAPDTPGEYTIMTDEIPPDSAPLTVVDAAR